MVEKCTVKESGGVSNENNDEWQKISPKITSDNSKTSTALRNNDAINEN